MRRFFVEKQSINENLAILSPEESRHIATVLRLKGGTAIELFDGSGYIYQGLILTVSPKRITVEILSRYSDSEESAPKLHFFQCLLKGKKMDLLIQKATELGVHTFCPVRSRYTESSRNLPRQPDRWNRIMLEACKQSKRAQPMEIKPVAAIETIDTDAFEQTIVLWEGEKTARLDATHISYEGSIALLVGPEGGFHEDDIRTVVEKGFNTISLGSRILRAETAALSSISIVQFLTGALAPARN